jgi:creatinine amidohydrolase
MTLKLAELSWPEIESALESGVRTVVVPTASTEQHGPGLPLNVDELRGDALGERIADELGCFVAPTIRPGVSEHHMAFPGTISLSRETFEAVVADYCESLDRHGFETVVLFTSHGGNSEALDAVAERMDEELDARVFVAGTRDGFSEARYAAMADHGVERGVAGQHAGAAETSFILEIRPDLVDMDAAAEGHVGEVDGEKLMAEGLASVTANGVLGDQTAATRAAGRTLIDECTAYYVEAIREELD